MPELSGLVPNNGFVWLWVLLYHFGSLSIVLVAVPALWMFFPAFCLVAMFLRQDLAVRSFCQERIQGR